MVQKIDLLRTGKINSFVFVRHPFDRIESAYFDKMVDLTRQLAPAKAIAAQIQKKCKYCLTLKGSLTNISFVHLDQSPICVCGPRAPKQQRTRGTQMPFGLCCCFGPR